MGVVLRGVSGSPGAAVGRVWAWQAPPRAEATSACDPDEELRRVREALDQARREFDGVARRAEDAVERDIFRAQAALLDDPAFVQVVEDAIEDDAADAVSAVRRAGEAARKRLEASTSERVRSKAADVDDVVERMLGILAPAADAELATLPEDAVVVGRDLRPSQTARLDRSRVRAFLLAEGGPTAHTAILARTYGIPAVVQLGEEVLDLDHGTLVGVDGDVGTVVVEPPEEVVATLQQRANARRDELASRGRIDAAETADGRVVRLAANIGSAEQARAAVQQGASEVGLFRTEFLFFERDALPDEKEQAEEYREAVEALAGGRVVFRTLDVGGDKPLPGLDVADEPNPMLGARGIRLSLEHRELLVTQLRAMLRASAAGPIGVMFPMVSTLDEVEAARDALAEARDGLAAEEIAIGDDVQVGVMVETPAAVFLAAELAAQLDFLSVGTNDLLQYLVAAERDSPTVAALLDPCHPALWRALELVVGGAEGTDAWVGVCGQVAGDPLIQLGLLGMGIDELSMVAAELPGSRERIAAGSYERWRDVVGEVLAQADAVGVRAVLERANGEDGPNRGPEECAPETLEREVEITHPEGLHARPAHAFVERAAAFDSDVTVTKGETCADAASLLEILSLGAEAGDRVRLCVTGADAEAALDGLTALLSGNGP